MAIKHKFSSAIPDGLDPALVKPSDWNNDHFVDFEGLAKSVSGVMVKATPGVDYLVPTGSGASLIGITSTQVGLGNVTNESKTTMFTSPAFTGTPTAPTAAVNTNTTQLSTCEFVLSQASNATPLTPQDAAVVGVSTMFARGDHIHPANFTATAADLKMDGTAAVGVSTKHVRADHVHPSDTSRAPVASPTFTGTVTAPTFASTITTGTAPFAVASNTMVTNLNANYLGGTALSGLVDTGSSQVVNGNKIFVNAAIAPNIKTGIPASLAGNLVSPTFLNMSGDYWINNAPLTFDSGIVYAGQRLLVLTPPEAAGVWDVVLVGTGNNGTWKRSSDVNTLSSINSALVYVAGGTYKQKIFKLDIDVSNALPNATIVPRELLDTASTQNITGSKNFSEITSGGVAQAPSSSGTFNKGITVTNNTYPVLQLYNTAAPVDKKYFRMAASTAGAFFIGRVNDAHSADTNFFQYDSGDNLALQPAGQPSAVFANIGTATNYHQFNASNGGAPVTFVAGANSDIAIGMSSRGTGSQYFYTNNANQAQFQISHNANAVNRMYTFGGPTGIGPAFYVAGTDANIAQYFSSLGTSPIIFLTQQVYEQFRINNITSAVNFLSVQGAAAGNPPCLCAGGSDANIDISLIPKGTGRVRGTMLSFACERSALPTVGQLFAFGNGVSVGLGAVMPFAGKIVAVGISGLAVTGTLVADAYVNEVANTSYQISVTGTGANAKAHTVFTTPLAFTAGTSLNWQVSTAPTAGTAWVLTFFVVFY